MLWVLQGNLPVHNSMDALAAAAFSYGSEESPKLVSFKKKSNLKITDLVSDTSYICCFGCLGS